MAANHLIRDPSRKYPPSFTSRRPQIGSIREQFYFQIAIPEKPVVL